MSHNISHIISYNIIHVTFIIILVCCLYMLLFKTENFKENFKIEENRFADTITDGYKMLKEKRFNAIDNQMRLDNINQRINKILTHLQTNSPHQRNVSNPIVFY